MFRQLKRPLDAALAAKRLAVVHEEKIECAFGRPGSDLLSRVLGRSTISAGAFHGRVRNGIGWFHTAIVTRERVEGRKSVR